MPLSYSQLSAYKKCPRQFEYAFVKKLKQPLTPEGAFGVGMHSALAKFGKREMALLDMNKHSANSIQQTALFSEESNAAESRELSAESLLEIWGQSFVTNGYESTSAAEFDRKRGEMLLRRFYDWWQKEQRKVLAVEKGFKLKEIDLSGRFDRVEELPNGTLRVIDFKTGGLRTQEQVNEDLQLSVYAMACKSVWGKEASELVMLFLCNEDLTEIRTERAEGELHTATKTIELLSERIASADYTPTPSKEVCRGCSYKRVCDVAAV